MEIITQANKINIHVTKSTTGSLNDLQTKIRTAINTKYNNDPLTPTELWPVDLIPDIQITSGNSIVEFYREDKYYKIPFTVNIDGTVTLSDPIEVEQNTTYDPVQKGLFVTKDDTKRLVTGPVQLPGCPDCDFNRGEKIFTVDEVESFCHAFNDYRMSDEMHLYGATGNIVGKVVENWTLKEPMTVKNINDETVELPVGTWMATTKILDEDTWSKIEDGTYRGYSGTYLSNDDAQKLLESLGIVNKRDTVLHDLFSATKRTLIADLKDPVPVTISIVDRPCVPNAIFTTVKSADKAGRSISNATLSTLQKAYEKAQSGLDNLKDLLSNAKTERADPLNDKGTVIDANKFNLEVDDMDEKQLAELISDKFDEKVKPITEELESIKSELNKEPVPEAVKCLKCEHELGEADKFCPKCGDAIEAEKSEVEKRFEAIESENQSLKSILEEKLGIKPESHKIDGQETPDPTPAKKTDADFYKEAGLKSTGRPLK